MTVALPAGIHVLRFSLDTACAGGSVGNFNWFRLTALNTPTRTPTRTATVSPGSAPSLTDFHICSHTWRQSHGHREAQLRRGAFGSY